MKTKEEKISGMSDEKLEKKIWKAVSKAHARAYSAFEAVMEKATREEKEAMLVGNLRVTDGGGIGYGEVWILDSFKTDKKTAEKIQLKVTKYD